MLVAVALLLAAPFVAAKAQDRPAAGRQSLVDLAFVLGQSHALRQTCQGDADQYWRSRMLRLLDLEAPDQQLKSRLIQSFTTGFDGARASFPSCTAAARAQAVREATRGRALAENLGSP